jgi:GTP-binding protein
MEVYSPLLMKKAQIVALNKIDLIENAATSLSHNEHSEASRETTALTEFIDYLEAERIDYFKISAATGEGVSDLMNAVAGKLAAIEREIADGGIMEWSDQKNWMKVSRIEDDPDYRDIKIEEPEEGVFKLSGKQLYKIFDSTNFNDYESLGYLNKFLVTNKVINKLKERGMQDGDTIRIRDFDMEWYSDD